MKAYTTEYNIGSNVTRYTRVILEKPFTEAFLFYEQTVDYCLNSYFLFFSLGYQFVHSHYMQPKNHLKIHELVTGRARIDVNYSLKQVALDCGTLFFLKATLLARILPYHYNHKFVLSRRFMSMPQKTRVR